MDAIAQWDGTRKDTDYEEVPSMGKVSTFGNIEHIYT